MQDVSILIDDVVYGCGDFLTGDNISMLKNVLYSELNKYEIHRKSSDICNEMVISIDNYNRNYINKFLFDKKSECLSDKSLKRYSFRLNDFCDNINKKVDDLTSDDIRMYLLSIKQIRNISNTTLQNIRLVLCTFYSWMFTSEYITKNPMKKIPPIKKDTMKEDPFTKSELELMRINCDNDRDRAIIEFLLSTGCRVSEACSVNRDQIDYYKKELEVIGKGNKQRTVYLTDNSLVYIKKYLDSRKDDNEALFVSINRNSSRLKIGTIEDILTKIGNKANIPNVHPHRFRHTLCNELLDKGVDVVTVREILGHSSLDTTMIYYKANKNKARMAYSML